jgi:hypothetical protein
MAEFGHHATIAAGVCIDAWGSGPFIITAAGKAWRFEDSDRFGPYLLRRDGSVADRQPGERSPFWLAHRLWKRQGRKVAGDGITCVFCPDLRPTTFRRDARGRPVVVEHGDEDGGFLELVDP